jgi:hypothetical protein
MAVIQGLKNLLSKFKELQKEAKRQTSHSVIVGYTAAYAIYVHENTEMKLKGKPRGSGKKKRGRYWDPQGRAQAKFLEQPAREMQQELGRVVAEVVKNGGGIVDGLLAAGLRLQRESQRLVPVDTGNLKNSAYTRKES